MWAGRATDGSSKPRLIDRCRDARLTDCTPEGNILGLLGGLEFLSCDGMCDVQKTTCDAFLQFPANFEIS